jgi:hypothetical protein
VDKVVEALGRFDSKRSPLAPEPLPVAKLREYSNYLTPQLGLFSGDTWAAVATVVRNLLLNWLVLIPLLAAVLGLPLWFLLVARTGGIPESWHRKLLIAALGIELIASVSLYAFRRFKKRPGTPQAYFIFGCVLPICVAAGALATAGLGLNFPWRDSSPHPCCTDLTDLWKFCALWCIGIPIVGWTVAEISARLFPSQTDTATDPQPRAAEGNGKPRRAAAR